MEEHKVEEANPPSLNNDLENYSDDSYSQEDEEISELMENHDLDKDEAEEVQELMDELGVDENDAVEIQKSL